MKYSTIFSAVLAALSVGVSASPIALPQSGEVAAPEVPVTDVAEFDALAKRETVEETAAYKAVKAAHGTLVADKYYAFTVTWPLGTAVEGSAESKTELQQLQQRLGFEHIGVVVGQVKETKSGKGKNEKTKKDFVGVLYHMVKANASPGDTLFKFANWKPVSGQPVRFVKETSAAKNTGAKKVGQDWVAAHKIYSVADNNCNSFAQNLIAKL